MHPDFKDVDAVAPAMGNHLIDVDGHEFHGMPFTMSWIYGVYGGRVTFYEQMIALDLLQSRPNVCAPIKATPSVAVAGYYPTQRCVHYDDASDAYVVSLEGFSYREAAGHARCRTARHRHWWRDAHDSHPAHHASQRAVVRSRGT